MKNKFLYEGAAPEGKGKMPDVKKAKPVTEDMQEKKAMHPKKFSKKGK
jgi:hypothetical protein